MSNTNVRAFSNGQNDAISSNDYINRKRAQAIYAVAASNITSRKSKYNLSNVPVKGNNNISSVGGYNVISYRLLLDLTKGKYYSAINGRNISLLSDNSIQSPVPVYATVNDCSATTIKILKDENLPAPITQTWNIREGPFLMDSSGATLFKKEKNTFIKCYNTRPYLSQNPNIIINNDLINDGKRDLSRLNNQDLLRDFNFPQNFCLDKIKVYLVKASH